MTVFYILPFHHWVPDKEVTLKKNRFQIHRASQKYNSKRPNVQLKWAKRTGASCMTIKFSKML